MARKSDNGGSRVAGLEKVDWKSIHHAYGPAVNIPELIRIAVSGRKTVAAEACGKLSNLLNHQGSIYPATAPAAPFLIEALRTTEAGPRVRAALLGILAGITFGAVGEMQYESDDATDAEPSDAFDIVPTRPVFLAVWEGVELYTHLLANDPDPDVHMEAAHLLGILAGVAPASDPSQVRSVVAMLGAQLGAEVDGLALSSVVFALGSVLKQDESLRAPFRQMLGSTDAPETVKVAAALALVDADGEAHTEQAAVDVLVDTMSRAPETDLIFQPRTVNGVETIRWSPWIEGKLRFRLCTALCDWSAGDEARMSRVLPALLVGIRLANGYTAAPDVGPVLRWLWPDRDIQHGLWRDGRRERKAPPPITPEELTGMRRTVVERCCANPNIWKPRIGNTDLVFMRVGLPASRDGLARLLRKS